MSKKKKTSAKQTKPNLQKPAAKPAAKPEKAAQAGKKSTSENQVKKETAAKPAQSQPQLSQENKPEPAKSDAGAKGKAEVVKKPEAQAAKPDRSAAKQSAPKTSPPTPKEGKKESTKETSKPAQAPPTETKKKDEPAPSGKKGAKGGKKKNKTPRQSVETSKSAESVEPSEPAEIESPSSAQPASAETVAESIPEEPPKADEPGQQRQVSKTLIDEDVPVQPIPDSSEPKQIAKTLLEISIGGLKEAAAKATGMNKAEPAQPKKVTKTIMEMDTAGLRDAVEASSRAIEDEIAAALKESEAEAASQASASEISAESADANVSASENLVTEPVAEAPKQPTVPPPADRRIAKTMLDFKAEEFFDLAYSEVDTLVDEEESQLESETERASEPAVQSAPAPSEPESAPEPPAEKPRRVAKTMLEIDAPDVNAILEAARQPVPETVLHPAREPVKEALQEPVAEEPAEPMRTSYDDVSMEDLNEFAQALKDDMPMSPPGSRAARLKKTMLGIRKHGLVSSPSMPGVSMTGESKHPEAAAEPVPVRVSRSLHPLDNFSFDNLCPADEDVQSQEQSSADAPQSFAPDAQSESRSEMSADSGDAPEGSSSDWQSAGDQGASERRRTGTVEMDNDPHEKPADGEFKGVTTVWPHDQEQAQQAENQKAQAKDSMVKAERFVPKTMLDMDFLKESLSASIVRAEEKLAESIALKAAEPPKQLLNSDDYKMVTKNCPFAWTENPDNPKDRVKYCTECSAQIYNFAGYDLAEAEALIFKRENRSNVTIYKREDGKFMTNDCPIALKKHKNTTMLVGGAAVILVLLVIMVVASFMAPQPPTPPAPPVDAGTPSPPTSDSSKEGTITGTRPLTTAGTAAGSGTTSSTATGKDAPGTFHYKRGQGIIQQPVEPVVVPQDDTAIPGTTSGYDEQGKFWQYTDKGNN